MAKCPECGLENIEDKIEWEEEDGERDFELDDCGVHIVGNCPECGHVFHDQYIVEGLYDPVNGEYVKRYY